MVRALRTDAGEPALPIAAPAADAAYRALYVVLGSGVVVATAFAAPDTAALALARYTGAEIVRNHSIPLHLGAETFTAAGAYSGGLGWLGALTTELLGRGGYGLALFATILVALTAFALVELRARRAGGRIFSLAAVALALGCAPGALGLAGGIVSAAFAAALAYILERPGPRAAAAATALTVLWCNVAPEGILAPLIALCLAAETTFGGRSIAERRWARGACAGTALGTLATPALLSFPALALEALRIDRALDGIVPLHPADVAPIAYRVGFTLAVFAALALGLQRGREGSIPLLIFGAMLALANGAFVVVFGVLVAPLLAGSARAAFPRVARIAAGSLRADLWSGGGIVLLAAVLAWYAGSRPAPLPPGYQLAAALAADRAPHRLYCYNIDWCGEALARAPAVRVFMDGRIAAYPLAIRELQRDIVRLKGHWRKVLDDDRVDALLARKDRPLATIVAMSRAWHVVASDASAVLYERTLVPR
jgi:hypothetical protein